MRTFGRDYPHNSPYAGCQGVGVSYQTRSGAVNDSRILYHSGLDSLAHRRVVYPRIPDETPNFTHDIHGNRKVAHAQTLSSMVTSKYAHTIEDQIIREIFRPTGGLSVPWSFIHKVERLWLNDPDWDNGEYLLWRPLDRTPKAFAVNIVGLLLNGEDWEPEYRGSTKRVVVFDTDENNNPQLRASLEHDHYAVNEFEIQLAIMAELPPSGSVFAVGGSSMSEASLFNINEVA